MPDLSEVWCCDEVTESAWTEENNERSAAANTRVPFNCSLSYFRGISHPLYLPFLGCVREAATVSRYREAEAQLVFPGFAHETWEFGASFHTRGTASRLRLTSPSRHRRISRSVCSRLPANGEQGSGSDYRLPHHPRFEQNIQNPSGLGRSLQYQCRQRRY